MLEVDQLTIRWYSDTGSITISGSKDEEIKSYLRDLVKEAVDHADMNTYEIHNNESIDRSNLVRDEKSLESEVDVSPQTHEEDLIKIQKKIEKIEKKLECKINDISFEVCKLKESDSLDQTMSREYIKSIKENNAQLKAENISLKKELDCATLVMSDLNMKIKMMEEEKRSLVTALKILQVNEIEECKDKRWHTASYNKQQKVSLFNPTEALTDSEDSCLLVNRFSELIDEVSVNEQRPNETIEQNEQIIEATSQEKSNSTIERQGQQKKSQSQKTSRKKGQKNQVCENEHQTEQDRSNEINRTDNCDSSNLSKRDLDSNKPKSDELKSILVIGDSIIKHIDPNKLSRRVVRKFTYRGKTCEEISEAVDDIQTTTDPSHIIIHCGTNNLPTDTAEVCATKIVNLARKVRNKFPNSKVGVSGLTYREDIAVNPVLLEVNEKLKKLSATHEFSYIDDSKIDNTCLNWSKLHLNEKRNITLGSSFHKICKRTC